MATTTAAPVLRRLLCVAPLVPAGGVETVLAAFGMLAEDRPELSVDVVGGGPLSRPLHARAAYLGVAERVRFRGPLSARAVRTAVHGCAVLVLPYRDGDLAVPTAEAALVEALATACPVVATPQAVEHLVEPDTGLVVPPDAPTVLAQALVTALEAPVRADLHGAAGTRPTTASRSDREGHLLRRAWLRVVR